MHRFFSPPDRCSSSVFSLSESEARHASQVLRLGPGDHLEILDGQGGLIEAEILASSRKSVEVQVVRRQTVPRPHPGVVLLQALLKGKALEADKKYKIAGWASVQENVKGEPIWDVVAGYLRQQKVIKPPKINQPTLVGVDRNPGVA